METLEIVAAIAGLIGSGFGFYFSLREAVLKKYSELESAVRKVEVASDRRNDEIESFARRNEANINTLFFLIEFIYKHPEYSEATKTVPNSTDTSIPTGFEQSSGDNPQCFKSRDISEPI